MIGETLGHYRISGELGSGGMGVVYEAEDLKLGRKVALKFIPEQLSDDASALERLQREARAASSLNHPNICTIHAIEQAEGRHFIVMERLEGTSLDRKIAGRALPLPMILDVGIQTADALDSAHQQGIIHRDIKPANLFITSRAAVKILDFGLAKVTGQVLAQAQTVGEATPAHLTSPGTAVGTVAYMSPEQARGEELDARSDLFSFGAVLYEMATGRLAFQGNTSAVIFNAILEKSPPDPHTLNEHVPAKLTEIIAKALEKDRDLRVQTAAELRADLKRLKRDTDSGKSSVVPVATRLAPASPASSSTEILLSEAKRHKGGIVAAIFVLLLLIAGAVFGVYSLLHKPAPRTQADLEFVRLTNSGRVDGEASISADGRYATYVLTEHGKQSLWMHQVATGSAVKIVPDTDEGFRGTTFSRDGDFIYYNVTGNTHKLGSLFAVPVLGGEPRHVLDNITGPVTFSPDGKRIAFIRLEPKSGEYKLIRANGDDSDEKTLAAVKVPAEWFSELGPSWSPDGKRIALGVFSFKPSLGASLVMFDAETGDRSPLGSFRLGGIARVLWTPNGDGLILTGNETPSRPFQLFFVSFPSGEISRITRDANRYGGVSLGLTGDGKSIITIQGQSAASLWTFSLADPKTGKQVTSGTAADGIGGLAVGPSGEIAYTSTTNDSVSLWYVDRTGNGRQITKQSLPSGIHFLDDHTLAFIDWMKDSANIYQVNLDGSGLKQFTSGHAVTAFDVSVPNRKIVYAAWENGKASLWSLSLPDGKPVQVTKDVSADFPKLSPDGKTIFACLVDASVNQSRAALLSAADGSVIRYLDMPDSAMAGAHWTPDGTAIAYVDTVDEATNVWVQPVAGGARHRLTAFADTEGIWNFDFTSDGKSLVLSRGRDVQDLVLIKNFR